MPDNRLGGVIAAVITPVDAAGVPDTRRLIERARHLFATGCDGLNLLGTTGEATSFSVAQRRSVMKAVAAAGLPVDRMMVGTGAASVPDATELTRIAADLGFAAALVLPPFYYTPVTDDGVARYLGAIIAATADSAIPIYLYNYPALSGVPYTIDLLALLLDRFGERIWGLKDSSGDLAYAEQVVGLSPRLRVFPSNEAVLLRARAGDFAGCISATANLNAPFCAAAFHDGDTTALERAVAIRALFAELPLVPGVKALVARLAGDPTLRVLAAPLDILSTSQSEELSRRVAALPADSWQSWNIAAAELATA